MTGNRGVVEALNRCLSYELASIDQLLIIRQDWANERYHRLGRAAKEWRNDAIDAAGELVYRLRFLETVASYDHAEYDTEQGADDPLTQLQAIQDVRLAAHEALNAGMKLAGNGVDEFSYDVMEGVLKPTVRQLEKLRALIKRGKKLGPALFVKFASDK